MTHKEKPAPKSHRFAAIAAVFALAAVLSGCVVYPVGGPGYYGHSHYWHHGWR